MEGLHSDLTAICRTHLLTGVKQGVTFGRSQNPRVEFTAIYDDSGMTSTCSSISLSLSVQLQCMRRCSDLRDLHFMSPLINRG